MKPLQQCDPEDETDGGSTLGGGTNTQVLKRLTTELKLNATVIFREMMDFIQLQSWRNLQPARTFSIDRWLLGQFLRPCGRLRKRREEINSHDWVSGGGG